MSATGLRGERVRPHTWDARASLAVAVVALLLYLPTVPDAVLQGDPGEFQLAATIGGLAHSTGYPLYLLLGWLWTRVTLFASPAYALNLLSALAGAASAGLVTRLVLALVPSSPAYLALPAAMWSGVALAIAPTFWSQSIVAEVYTLHTLLWVLLALAVLAWARRPDRWWVIALLAGLGLAHHRMTVLYLPWVLACLVLPRPQGVTRRHIVAAALAGICPILLYVYLPLRAPHTPYLDLVLSPGDNLVLYQNDIAGFLDFVSGQPFESALTTVGVADRARAALGWAAAEVGPAAWLLALAGAAWLLRRRRAAAVLLCGALVTNVGFNLLYNIGDIAVFYLPVYQTALVLAGTALAACGTGGGRRLPVAALALTVVLGGVSAAGLAEARSSAVASIPVAPAGIWDEILDGAPADAVLLSNDRNEIVPMWYYQYAEGARPDLLGLFPLISSDPEYAHIGVLAQRALATGREVCLIKEMPGLAVGFQLSQAQPPLYCIDGVWQAPTGSQALALSSELDLLGWEGPEAALQPGDEVTVVLYWQPHADLAAPYSSYVHLVTADGDATGAGSDHRPGDVYLPADLWSPGQVIRDEHVFSLPDDAAPGAYRFLVGMYEYPSLTGYGQSLVLGDLLVVSADQ